ncbi:hypothetical protein AQS8620_01218 [Aquimixticola soesokkakensis]|uniref:Uncharacterized protein n=1 Tax=Aquimixticola soesokkakensis TaxID=1519096 RepID=A0A1Y5S956_9RHOB|nr:DUF2161 family putative PD-(D/E)XK-type phosphodiesterase [Aquimixticola soesokkakensis]SLN35300.1 hypothetical protein AQS8620_01218 [Aquimixticola soesokkakensis]
MKEADLYAPVKAFLEAQGYVVKAEIGACDVMAVRGSEPPVVVELKTGFSLALVLQGIDRQRVSDAVYLAVPKAKGTGWKLRYKDIVHLCRRLGLGLLAVDVAAQRVEAHLDPAPYQPRKNTKRAGQLLKEFTRRIGDPNVGGTTGVKRVTAYRQDAQKLRAYLGRHGPSAPAQMARALDVPNARAILADNHYGWFARVSRGIYALAEPPSGGPQNPLHVSKTSTAPRSAKGVRQ